MERKWTDRQYHVQDSSDIVQKDVRMYCNTNKFPELPFCGPHFKPRGAIGLSKHYHLRFDPKIVNSVCAIRRTMCMYCVYINAIQTLYIWYTIR